MKMRRWLSFKKRCRPHPTTALPPGSEDRCTGPRIDDPFSLPESCRHNGAANLVLLSCKFIREHVHQSRQNGMDRPTQSIHFGLQLRHCLGKFLIASAINGGDQPLKERNFPWVVLGLTSISSRA